MLTFCPTRFQMDVLPFYVTQLTQSISAGLPQVPPLWLGKGKQIPDARDVGSRLPMGSERPQRSSAADHCDKLSPPQVLHFEQPVSQDILQFYSDYKVLVTGSFCIDG
jgi:hypothetical protein